MSKLAKKEGDDSEDEEQGDEGHAIPDHLIRILDGLAQEDDDLELDQAAASLTACIGKGRSALRVRASPIALPCSFSLTLCASAWCTRVLVPVCYVLLKVLVGCVLHLSHSSLKGRLPMRSCACSRSLARARSVWGPCVCMARGADGLYRVHETP